MRKKSKVSPKNTTVANPNLVLTHFTKSHNRSSTYSTTHTSTHPPTQPYTHTTTYPPTHPHTENTQLTNLPHTHLYRN